MNAASLPVVPLIQISAIGITAAFYAQSNNYKWLIAVYIFAFSHYLIGALYSRKILIGLLSSPKSYLPLALLGLIGWFAYEQSFSLLLYFGLHHALSEAYLRPRFFKIQALDTVLPGIQISSFWVHLSGFFLLVRNDRAFFYDIYLLPVFFVFLVSLAVYILVLWRNRLALNTDTRGQLFGSELILLSLLLLSLVYPVTFLQVVFYHFTLWALLPFLRVASPGSVRPLTLYSLLTLISLAVILYYSPYYVPISSRFHLYEYWFILLSYAHITLSFALSNANPAWINRLFAKS